MGVGSDVEASLLRDLSYLTQAQRVTRTGSWGVDARSREFSHCSDEHKRLYGFDPRHDTPSVQDFVARIHPDDQGRCLAALDHAIRDGSSIDVEFRVLIPGEAQRRHRALADPVFGPSGSLDELVGASVDITDRRQAEAEAERLADEQAALRRVATLVAKEAPPAEVLAKVAEEVASVLGGVECSLFRDEGDGTATRVARHGAALSARGDAMRRFPVDGDGVIATVLRTGMPHRIDDLSSATGAIATAGRDELGVRSAVGCPIVVRGRVWGAVGAAFYEPSGFSAETEARMARFADLAATAVANAEARAEVTRLADLQSALRRVATLVAEGVSPNQVFDAVASETAALLDADGVTLCRYEPGGDVSVVAHRGPRAVHVLPGARVRHDANTVSAPIMVDGSLWGAATAYWAGDVPPPHSAEERMAQFAELIDTAIANADSRDLLTASRARLVTEADHARRRVVRDLHDGAQQRLVHTIIALKLALRSLRSRGQDAESLTADALAHAERANEELRELAHGILPVALASGGLRAGVDAVVERIALPVRVEVPARRLAPEIEASAYFIVAEALTNVVKYAGATSASVTVAIEDHALSLEVRDDGVGGADAHGHGLVGLRDRATALGGRLDVQSPAGGGTVVAARLPLLTA